MPEARHRSAGFLPCSAAGATERFWEAYGSWHPTASVRARPTTIGGAVQKMKDCSKGLRIVAPFSPPDGWRALATIGRTMELHLPVGYDSRLHTDPKEAFAAFNALAGARYAYWLCEHMCRYRKSRSDCEIWRVAARNVSVVTAILASGPDRLEIHRAIGISTTFVLGVKRVGIYRPSELYARRVGGKLAVRIGGH